MYLRRLEILGFKSFAQKTELNFPHGVAAVVGPNGCGKSNVLDAIRWCLGEQSAKALRGGEMADVIFNGADSRAAVGMAEVTMTFTDCEAQLGTAYHEVSITRRVYRDGRGEYLLNRTGCRLRDIQELFMDTGIGRSAYSIMEQGKIDLILSSRPEDRRAIFEEAAGITKYKAQRKEATRKLEQTDANLTRLTDVIGEVKRQLGSLQRQAAKARKHRTLSGDLRLLDTHLAHEQYSRLEHELRGAREESARLQAAHAEASDVLRAGETSMQEQKAELQNASEDLQGVRAMAQEYRDRLRSAQSQREYNRERTAESQGILTRYEAELTGAEERLAAQVEQLLAVEEEERQIAGLLQIGQGDLRDQEAAVRAARTRRMEAEGAHESAGRAVADGEKRLAAGRAELTRLTQQQQAGEARREMLVEEATRLSPLQTSAAERVTQTRTQIAAAQTTLEARRQELRMAEDAETTAQKALVAADAALAGGTKALAGSTSRWEVLRGLNEAGAGFSSGVQAVLRGLDQPELFKGSIIGVLGSSLEVEARFIPAVEAALGQHLQTVLLRDEEVAAAMLEALATGKKVGRATLKSLGQAQTAARIDGKANKSPLPGEALVWAVDIVKCAPMVEPLVAWLLADCVIVETLEVACEIRRRSPQHGAATLHGEYLDKDGFLHGGQSNGESVHQGILQRQAQIRALEVEVEAGKKQVAAFTRVKQEAAVQGHTTATEVAESRENLQTEQVQIATIQNQQALLEREERDLRVRLENLRREQEQVAKQCGTADGQVGALTSRTEEIDAVLQRCLAERAVAQEKTGIFRAQENTLAEALNELRVRVATEQQRHEGLRRQRLPMDARRTELAQLIEQRRRELEEHRGRLERYAAEAGALEEQIENARQELIAIEADIETRRQLHAAASEALSTLEADLQAQRQALSGFHDRRSREEVRETQLRLRQENVHAQTVQRHGVDLQLFIPEPAAFLNLYQSLIEQPGASVEWARVETLAAALREKLDAIGTVNVDAIAEHDALEERYQFLESQNADLLAAKKELFSIIGKINATSKDLFAETFERVRANFQEMYTELFGGGRSNLLLANEEDPLECGIDIIARPPGKQLQSITLLSGGEKTMTAVALLFAIYMVKPSPFCVLDEMDAPLDESNISRFLKILDRFVSQSQFIVITHNKRTIARADVLYGVTMEEAGVSKLVAVRLARREQERAVGADLTGTANRSALSGAVDESATGSGLTQVPDPEPPSIAQAFGKHGDLCSERTDQRTTANGQP